MSFQFNPTTGNLERVGSGTGTGVTFLKEEIIVDAAFLLLPEIDLGVIPIVNSDLVYLNGLLVGSACYTITANVFQWNNSSELRENDYLFIRFNG